MPNDSVSSDDASCRWTSTRRHLSFRADPVSPIGDRRDRPGTIHPSTAASTADRAIGARTTRREPAGQVSGVRRLASPRRRPPVSDPAGRPGTDPASIARDGQSGRGAPDDGTRADHIRVSFGVGWSRRRRSRTRTSTLRPRGGRSRAPTGVMTSATSTVTTTPTTAATVPPAFGESVRVTTVRRTATG